MPQFSNKMQGARQHLSTRFTRLQSQLKAFRPYNLGGYAINGLTPKKGYSVQKNLAYGIKPRQRLDLYVSDQKESKGLILFVHGGAWSRGDKDTYVFVGEAFSRYGYDVAVLNYHLAPEFIFPRYVDDLAEALDFLEQNQKKLGISTDKIALMGHSAGAFNIASLIYHPSMYQLKLKQNIRTMIGISGPYHFDYKNDPLAQHAFDQLIPYDQVMPYYFVEKNHIQHYLLIAENDQIVKHSNSLDLCAQLHSQGNHCEVIHIPNTGHITIMGSVSSLFSRFYETRQQILNALDCSMQD